MTSDELISLVEDIVEGLKVVDLRQGITYKPVDELSDPSWGVLVRFVGGERPSSAPDAAQGRGVSSFDPAPEQDLPPKPQPRPQRDRRNQDGNISFPDGHELGGVVLP